VQQILIVLVIILKRRMRLIERAPTMIIRAVLVITIKMMIMERMLVVLEYKEGGKDRYYRLY
jgi:hypothetical protein